MRRDTFTSTRGRGSVYSREPTFPAINCPKPGGNVSVVISKVTTAGNSRRLNRVTRKMYKKKQINITPDCVTCLINVSDLLFDDKSFEGLLFPYESDKTMVEVDVESSSQATGDTAERRTQQFAISFSNL